MIAIADINTIWRRKPFEAMSASVPVLGLAPRDFLSASSVQDLDLQTGRSHPLIVNPVILPPGWATKWAAVTGLVLWKRILSQAARRQMPAKCLVVTTPHYLPLVRRARAHLPVFYYCSDDYSQYLNWGGEVIQKKESELIQAVSHSFFVSKTLAARAVDNGGINEDRVSVSANAADERFLQAVGKDDILKLLSIHPKLKRPIVGVVGGVNDRLDFELILECANRPEVGSVVMVGGVDPACQNDDLKSLREHPKCLFAGGRPHSELPLWLQTLDIGLIPYRDTPLNKACSPMRLFDHLASGAPIFATPHCQQTGDFEPYVFAGSGQSLIQGIIGALALDPALQAERRSAQKTYARQHTWKVRADKMLAKFQEYF